MLLELLSTFLHGLKFSHPAVSEHVELLPKKTVVVVHELILHLVEHKDTEGEGFYIFYRHDCELPLQDVSVHHPLLFVDAPLLAAANDVYQPKQLAHLDCNITRVFVLWKNKPSLSLDQE
jgi:hypothetical protein